MTTITVQLIPAVAGLLVAVAALVRAEAAHRRLEDHQDTPHRITTSAARISQSGTSNN